MKNRLELISFKLCPYVQRSVITLKYKKAPFEITYIELDHPPAWFDKVSPLGQVPVLKVNDQTAIFESAVINEYIDETVGTPLHPADPLQKAFERAWIEFGSGLMKYQYLLLTTQDRKEAEEHLKEMFEDMKRLEDVLKPGEPCFRGKEFGLVDAAYAPFFMRVFLAEKLHPESKNADPRWREMPKVVAWAKSLLAMPVVQESVVPEFAQLFREYAQKAGSLYF